MAGRSLERWLNGDARTRSHGRCPSACALAAGGAAGKHSLYPELGAKSASDRATRKGAIPEGRRLRLRAYRSETGEWNTQVRRATAPEGRGLRNV